MHTLMIDLHLLINSSILSIRYSRTEFPMQPLRTILGALTTLSLALSILEPSHSKSDVGIDNILSRQV